MRRAARAVGVLLAGALTACGSVARIIPPLLPPPDTQAPLAPDDQRYQVELVYAALLWAADNTPTHPIVYFPRDPSQMTGSAIKAREAETLTKRLRQDANLEPAPSGDLNLACTDQGGVQNCHYAPYQAIVYPEGQAITGTTGHARIRVSYNASAAEVAAAAAAAGAGGTPGRRGIIDREYCLSLTRVGDRWTVADAVLGTQAAPIALGACAKLGR
ncbi:MAG TPA: hypothetical protein VMH39_12325 [Gemmatimonadaceae bacterium]|nr:hypothetical protein [Gemmatimonadaceae bacterium]